MWTNIQSSQRSQPPAWAVLQRQLIQAIDQAAPIFIQKYTRPGGTLIWREDYPGDGVWADDLYESFFNWPLYYALGGSDYTGQMAFHQWNAITRQITHDYGRAYKEFINNDDWLHNSENYIYFYALGLADPTNAEMMRRACRFAGFYMNQDPSIPNYDSKHRIIRSPFSGSKGPLFHARYADVQYNIEHGHATLGPDFEAPPSGWYNDEGLRQKIHSQFNQVVMQGDVPVNLGAVALIANAYLYTQADQYRDWVVDYVQAWLERVEQNNGIIPDNIGLNGKIGENRQGQWWGGFYGWTGTFSHQMMFSAMTVASECAYLITGDASYLHLLRSQLDLVLDQAIEQEGEILPPHKYTDDGWCDYRPMIPQPPIHLWAVSQADHDWNRLEKLRKGNQNEWQQVTSRGPRSLDDRAWTQFLAGACPNYPQQILEANYRQVCDRVDMIRNDEADLTQIDEHHWQQRNPVLTEALEHLTTGAPQTIYWGGMTQGQVRHFDPQQQRPGLPEDVAALVTKLDAESIDLTLVNLSAHAVREVIISAGSFRQHQFTQVKDIETGNLTSVNDSHFQVHLLPGTEINLHIGIDRFCNQPSYAFPWHDQTIPFR